MTGGETAFLALAIGCFAIFAVFLAWANHKTEN